MDYIIRQCQTSDLDVLRNISIETYYQTFHSSNSTESMNQYLIESFNSEKLYLELTNQFSFFFFLYISNEIAGYLKLNLSPSQSDINDPISLELERIYIRSSFKEQGFGRILINFVYQAAASFNKKFIWLGVWEKNKEAIAFYTKMGFEISGKHEFRMGQEIQTDYIMKKYI